MLSRTSNLLTKRRDPTFALALLAALAVHLLVLRAGHNAVARNFGWWLTPPPVPHNSTAQRAALTAPHNDMDIPIGEAGGQGRSVNSADGDQPMQSEITDLNQIQALMQRDPVGFNHRGSPQQLQQALQDQQQSAAQPSPKTPSQQQQQNQQQNTAAHTDADVFAQQESQLDTTPKPTDKTPPLPISYIPKTPGAGTPNDSKTIKPTAAASASPPAPQPTANPNPNAPAAASPPSQQPPPQPQQTASAPPDPSSSGVPLPSGDYESDPVALTASSFTAGGSVEAQDGQKIITRQLPDMGMAGWSDVYALGHPSVTLRLTTGKDGNVIKVDVISSGGSVNIDLPCQRAAATWWLQPKNPKTGQPYPSVRDIDIQF